MPVVSRLLGSLRRRKGACIAVLPLACEDELLGVGAAEAVIGLLGPVRGLDVIGPRSTRALSQRTTQPSDVLSELRADLLFRGQIERSGGTLHIGAQLVRTPSGSELWSANWSTRAEDLFGAYSEIAHAVATALGLQLPTPGDALIHREPTSDLKAYDLYLQGRDLLTRADFREALQRFESAVDRDALFALAWAAIAETYREAAETQADLDVGSEEDAVRSAASRALELNGALAPAHVSIGYAEMRAWRLEAAEAHMRRALELSPCHADAHRWLSRCLLYRGDFDTAIRAGDRAVVLEPLSDTIVNESGWPYALSGKTAEAIERSRRVVHRDPEHAMAYSHLGKYAEQDGRPGEAVTYYRAAAELSGRLPSLTAFLGIALVRTGDRHAAEEIAHDLARKARRGSPVATSLGALLVKLGRVEEGLVWLEAAREAREPLLLLVGSHWLPLPEIEDDSRYRELLARLPDPVAAGRRA